MVLYLVNLLFEKEVFNMRIVFVGEGEYLNYVYIILRSNVFISEDYIELFSVEIMLYI